MADASVPSVIFDIGSKRTKAGFSNDVAPIAMFPTVVGMPRRRPDSEPLDTQTYFAEEAFAKFDTHVPKRPVEFGIVSSWELWEELIKYTYDKRLGVEASDHPVVMVQPILNPKINREKMAQIMFETMRVPQFYLGSQASFSMRSSGLKSSTGLIVDIGDSTLHPVPVSNNCYLPFTVQRTELCANQIHENFVKHVTLPDGSPIYLSSQYRDLTRATEKFAFVSGSFCDDELKPESEFERPFTLSDGTQLTVGRARYRAAEVLFKPSLAGLETMSLTENILACIRRCDPSIRSQLSWNIILSGGYAAMPGLQERLSADIKRIEPNFEHATRIRTHPHPTYSAWAGAQLLTQSPTFTQESMSMEEYDEYGPSLVHRIFCCN